VVTVHDLSFLRYPEFFSARKNFWHRALGVKKTLRAAERIIAVSANTKNDIIELAGVAPEKISVIYSGNNAVKREADAKPRSERFILYLGNIEPRKNINGLIAAYDQLRVEGENIKLILAGAPGWKNKKIYAARDGSRYKNDIIFLGYISQKDKEDLLRKATIFVYPSYYEGFGFPPLEAMASGVPVVCSNVSSLPEVVADAALMINPFKDEEIKDALKIILTDEKLRARLIAKGYERAKLFSWDKTAAQYLQLFKEVYEEKK
jgi:glycosyltransferase involved in cell wall biosynthesis